MSNPADLSKLIHDVDAEVQDLEKKPLWLLRLGPAFLMGLGFFVISLAAQLITQKALTTLAVVLVLCGIVCFRLSRIAQQLEDAGGELKRFHSLLLAVACVADSDKDSKAMAREDSADQDSGSA